MMQPLRFDAPSMFDSLIAMTSADFDELPFGLIGMTLSNVVTVYNRYEAEMAGFARERVLGKHFFLEIAPCTNNAMVAGIFDLATTVDQIVPYIFTLRAHKVEVRLRLLKNAAAERQFLLVERV